MSKRPLYAVLLLSLGALGGCDEAAKPTATAGTAASRQPVTAPKPLAAPERHAKPADSLKSTAVVRQAAEMKARGTPELLAVALARYQALNGRDNGTEGHPLGLTMHRRTLLLEPQAPFNVRVGEEDGKATAHELKTFFLPATVPDVERALGQILPATLGGPGHVDNARTVIRAAMGDFSTEDCKAVRLGPWQFIAVFRPEVTGGNHEISLLLGDTRATGQGSRKLLGMLDLKARKCSALRVDQ